MDEEWWGYKVYMTGDEAWGGPTMAGVIPVEDLAEVDAELEQLPLFETQP